MPRRILNRAQRRHDGLTIQLSFTPQTATISPPCLACGIGPGLAEGPGDIDGGILHFQLQELARRQQPQVTIGILFPTGC
jgi:hypothetical protein